MFVTFVWGIWRCSHMSDHPPTPSTATPARGGTTHPLYCDLLKTQSGYFVVTRNPVYCQ